MNLFCLVSSLGSVFVGIATIVLAGVGGFPLSSAILSKALLSCFTYTAYNSLSISVLAHVDPVMHAIFNVFTGGGLMPSFMSAKKTGCTSQSPPPVLPLSGLHWWKSSAVRSFSATNALKNLTMSKRVTAGSEEAPRSSE